MTLNPIRGTSAADTLTGISGADEIFGLGGNDALKGGSGDLLRGGSGDDELRVVAGLGETWSDIAGAASLFGEAGNDVLKLDPISGAGPSLLSGGDGTDYIHVRGLHRNLAVDGGLGVDLAWFNFIDVPPSAQDAAHLVLRADGTGHLDMGTDRLGTFVGLERVNLHLTSIGTDDVVLTAGGNDMVSVGDGANRVGLGDGDDLVEYRPGLVNTLSGGAGNDTLSIDASTLNRAFSFDAVTGQESIGSRITGFETFYYLGVGQSANVIFRVGEDQFYGGSVTDRARMGGGADYFTGGGGQDRGWGEGGDDWLKGDAGNDLLDGGTGTDSVEGGAGRDTLWGGDGNDSVWGGGGADRLEGGTGTDHLWGAAGADVFRFGSTGKAADVIHDFEAGIDTVAVARGRIGGALGGGDLAGARFHADAPAGTRGQFVLHDEGRNDRLVWDANGTTAGGVVQIAVLSGESGLTAGDILIY